MIARSRHLLYLAAAFFAASALLLASGCGRAPAAAVPAVKPVLVRTETVVYSNEAVPIFATGVLARRTEADLSFKIGGVVEAVLGARRRPRDKGSNPRAIAARRNRSADRASAQARSKRRGGISNASNDCERMQRCRWKTSRTRARWLTWRTRNCGSLSSTVATRPSSRLPMDGCCAGSPSQTNMLCPVGRSSASRPTPMAGSCASAWRNATWPGYSWAIARS